MDLSLMTVPAAMFLTVVALTISANKLLLEDRALVRRRLRQHATAAAQTVDLPASGTVLREHRLSAIAGLDRILAGRSFTPQIEQELARASIPLRVSEYLLLRWLLALALLAIGQRLTGSWLIGLPLGLAGYALPHLFVRHRQGQRLQLFNDQLVETITLISNSLKSGYSFLQGMEAVAREMPAPTSQEFAATIQEIQVGSAVEDALANLARRVGSDDLDMVVTAILIHRSAGGNLSEVLDNIAQTIRERMRILREVRTLTAQERISGYIVGALPIIMIVVISVLNRRYVDMLFNETNGQIMLAIAAVLEVIGFWMIRRIVDIEV
ncbi:MAG: type II secretion system F family protein [Chloroflexi bacterium]|nr:type II secretion system F family protein [Chloroflexota bacterium]